MKICPKCGYSMMLYLMGSRAYYKCTCCNNIEDSDCYWNDSENQQSVESTSVESTK